MHEKKNNVGLLFLSLIGTFFLGRVLFRHRLVVLTYHRVLPGGYPEGGLRPPDSLFSWEFEQQIAYLVRRYHVVTGEEVRAFLSGAGSLPAYSVLITFDDGYENNYTEAFPILQRYGVSATFFLSTGQIGEPGAVLWFDRLRAILSAVPFADVTSRLAYHDALHNIRNEAELRLWFKRLSQPRRDRIIAELEQDFKLARMGVKEDVVSKLMTWDQVREMAAKGMTIGSHTSSHQILSRASSQEVLDELISSRRRIEDEIGQPCWAFSYPNGTAADFRLTDKLAVQSAGYVCAFTQIAGLVTPATDCYALPRIPVPGSSDMRVFFSRLTGVHHMIQAAIARV